MTQSRTVFFDLETGGLDPARHAIIQIAAIAVDDECRPMEAFEAKVRFDNRKANKHSLRKNHYSRGLWANQAQSDEEVARNFAEFLRRHAAVPMTASNGDVYFVAQLVAHHAMFDGPFLQSWYERLEIYLPARRQVLCTMQRALWYFSEHTDVSPPKDMKLATLCHYFGIPFHAAAAHEALADVSATVGLYQAIRLRSPAPEKKILAA